MSNSQILTNLTFSSHNIRNLRSIFDSLLDELDEMALKPNVIALSEIWVNSDVVEQFKIKGYTTDN